MLDLQEVFGRDGPLQRALPDFRVRREQLRMAERVAQALAERASLIVEAGTGTGKTFAYLVPALLSGRRVLISTGTRALQDQLFSKDLPLLAAALGRPARVALLKGRANYLCRYRLEQLESPVEQLSFAAAGGGRAQQSMLARIRRWAHTTERGDLAEVRGLADDHAVWPLVTSTRETCLGPRCREAARCHVLQARREALEADVVIVNHHLLLADLALKEDGFGDLLGAADAIILDEAHQIPDLATQFFGARVSDRQVEMLLRDLRAELAAAAPPAARGESARAQLAAAEAALQALRSVAPTVRGAWPPGGSLLGGAVQTLQQDLEELSATLTGAAAGDTLEALAARCTELAASLERLNAVDELEGARTLELNAKGFALTLMPFDISARFRALTEARGGAWIFTSATLSVGEEFGHFSGRLGLESAPTLQIESPFDHERQSLLYLPPHLPAPASPAHTAAVIDTAEPLIRAAGGGAFVLFTSHRALAAGAVLLRARWQAGAPYRLLVQGEGPRERLLEEFRRDGNAVLLGTASFWEGVDVKGDALRLVIIEKLPFASPEDPLVRARIEHLNATGGNPFRDFQLPEAALALKQGAGRLIRSEDDHGVVVICDPRMTARAYGRVFFAALPPMSVTSDADEVRRFLARHAPAPARVATLP